MTARSRLGTTLAALAAVALLVASGCGGGKKTLPADAIAYFAVDDRGKHQLEVVSADGGKPVRLKRASADAGGIWWSPDGSRLVYLDDLGIWLMDADGSGLHRLTSEDDQIVDAAWSPDGSRLVYTKQYGGTSGMEHDAGAVAAEGGDPTLLATHAFSPQWSPDGKRLVFERCATTSLDCDIWVMDANGANEGALVSGPTFDSAPAWAPDGSRVAFSRSVRDADHEVMVVDADGENVRPVGTGPIAAGGPTWTPDGKSILFARSLGFQKGYDVWTIGADGSGLRRFLRRSCVPEWSPDGGRIVFVRPCDSEFQDVWVAAADGGNARRIATRAFGPTWRPAVPGS